MIAILVDIKCQKKWAEKSSSGFMIL